MMSDMDIDEFFPMELGLTVNNTNHLSYNGASPLQTISETGHFQPNLYNQSPHNYVPMSPSSPMSINPSPTYNNNNNNTPSSFSTTGFEVSSSFGGRQLMPGSSYQGASALTRRIKGDAHAHAMQNNSPVVNQSMSPMINYDTMGNGMGGRGMSVSSSMPQYASPINFGFPFNQDQMLSKQLDLNDYGIKSMDTPDVWAPTTTSSNNSFSTGAMQIPTGGALRRNSSMASSLGAGAAGGVGSHHHRHPYRRVPSLAFSDGTPDLMTSPLAPVVTMPMSPSPLSEHSSMPTMSMSMSTMNTTATTTTTAAGFTPEQIPAAQAIIQFIVEHPGMKIPANLIMTRELVEPSENNKGYCLIGNCGIVRAGQRVDPTYDPSTDKEYRKRTDHLLDHVKDKHFNSRPFTCHYANCTAAFAREADLKRHQEIHTGLKICCPDQTCGKTYTRFDNLGRHIKQKHPHLADIHSLPASSHIRHSTTPY